MKQIDVQPQPLLSFSRTFGIAISGVKYRLFRALVTVAVISVAMAFLMNILAESLIKKTIAETAAEQIAELRRIDRWIARLSVAQTAREIIEAASDKNLDATARANLRNFGQLDEDGIAQLQQLAAEAAVYLTFFEDLDYGRRRVLIGSAESTFIFDRLQDAETRARFFERLDEMKTVRFVTGEEAFTGFLDRWPMLKTGIERIRNGQTAAIQSIQQSLGDRSLLDAMREADGAFGEVMRGAGFTLPAEEASSLAGQVGQIADNALIEAAINSVAIRQAVAARRDVLPGDVTPSLVWGMLTSNEQAVWFLERMRENGYRVDEWTAEKINQLADERANAFLLKQAELATAGTSGGLMGIGKRMTWLAMVSMLVCAVGIANAMLMSVTERFREIATLKCLGALDGFIMTVFLIEASVLGLVGGVIGTLIGLIIASLRMLGAFKGLLLEAIAPGPIIAASLLSIGVGIILAAVSAVYPSFRAARLAPMEAMRIE